MKIEEFHIGQTVYFDGDFEPFTVYMIANYNSGAIQDVGILNEAVPNGIICKPEELSATPNYPKKKYKLEKWATIYKNSDGNFTIGAIYENAKSANEGRCPSCISIQKIEFEVEI